MHITDIIDEMIERDTRTAILQRELSKAETKRLLDLEMSLKVYYQWHLDEAKEDIEVETTTEISLSDKD